ncbi:hypothetical protein LMH87_001465 [Akanthomyces muscarius]|uniref:Uncharacterized protein n=1 Tax=Akanthomyces muscarius TaxID=2231603 RepID=A0A9W8Q6T5_AKAMU|nr:hypothetical protein LMH87_001465 [Akanthomyces muscarius]KAJ4146906.1 hypothetical protein LMH87_001465 [Akanthomyces muscarius]
MSDSPSIGITPSPSLPNIADGSSVHRCSIKEAVMYGIRHNQAEVAACVAANPDFVPLIHSVLPTAAEPGNPTPSAQPAEDAIDESSSSDEPPNVGSEKPAATGKKPDNAYRRAIAVANKLPLELGSVNILTELQHDLQRERARADHDAQQRQHAKPELRSQSEEEAANPSKNVVDNYHNLQPSPRFETAAERYWCIIIAQRYRAAKHSKEKHTCSVAESFARKYLPDKVKQGLSRRKLQDKWKTIMHQQIFWEQLATRCGGAGVLLLLSAEFQNEHARRLKIEDRAALFASIAARHPNLKHDITALTEILTYFFYNKTPPEWKITLPLENLPEADIATKGLRELLDCVDITSQIAVDGGNTATLPA